MIYKKMKRRSYLTWVLAGTEVNEAAGLTDIKVAGRGTVVPLQQQ